MKTTEKDVLKGIATTVGKAVGYVEGAVDAVKHTPRTDGPLHPAEPLHPDIFYETRDISPRGVFLTGVGVLVGTWVSIAIVYLVFHLFATERARSSPPPLPVDRTAEAVPPQPRLQQSPHRDLKAMQAHEDWELTHYHWADKAHGVVTVPIERAMQLIAERGIPPARVAPNATNTPPQEGSRLTGFEGKVEPEPR